MTSGLLYSFSVRYIARGKHTKFKEVRTARCPLAILVHLPGFRGRINLTFCSKNWLPNFQVTLATFKSIIGVLECFFLELRSSCTEQTDRHTRAMLNVRGLL